MSKALELLGDRWSLLIIRDLMLRGRHEFSQLRDSPEGIATNILTDRLKSLSEGGLINSIKHPTNGSKKLYYLTKQGKGLLPTLREMILWGDEFFGDAELPPNMRDEMRDYGDGFMADVLAGLDSWENQFLNTSA